MGEIRHQAARTLLEVDRKHSTAKAVWDGPRTGAETALVLGVLRRRGTLDAILGAFSKRKLPLLKPPTLTVLRVAAFELLFMDDAPDHAVVQAAGASARAFERYRDLSFVNAVLRNMLRGRKGDLVFNRSVFPNREHDPVGHLAARGSTAPWIARRRHEEHGFERALRILDLQASTPPLFLRSTIELPFERGPGGLYIAGPRIGDLFDRYGPHIVVQDAVASQVAPFLAPEPGWRVLDYCAAPGGKATHLAQLGARVTAHDADGERLKLVAENAQRLGLTELLVCEEPSGEYDAVLVDAPCSNTGVLARRPEARWRVKERHLKGMAERQLKILRDAASFMKPGGSGVLVYSTCSLEPEENIGVVDAFIARGGFVLQEAKTLYPDEAAGDGGFLARLSRV